ncbi:hypothetical protein JCM10450v2_003386 [Rhodotorula kratochvilovae]
MRAAISACLSDHFASDEPWAAHEQSFSPLPSSPFADCRLLFSHSEDKHATLLPVKVGRHTSWTTRITLSPPPSSADQTPLEVLFVLPKALMNISGSTVFAAIDGFLPPLAAPSAAITAPDDLDLAPSQVKYQRGGGPRGHNGVRSLSSALRGSRDFHRLWIGIGRPEERSEVGDYVLRPLSRDEVRACEYDEDEGKSGAVLERAWGEMLRVGFEEE